MTYRRRMTLCRLQCFKLTRTYTSHWDMLSYHRHSVVRNACLYMWFIRPSILYFGLACSFVIGIVNTELILWWVLFYVAIPLRELDPLERNPICEPERFLVRFESLQLRVTDQLGDIRYCWIQMFTADKNEFSKTRRHSLCLIATVCSEKTPFFLHNSWNK